MRDYVRAPGSTQDSTFYFSKCQFRGSIINAQLQRCNLIQCSLFVLTIQYTSFTEQLSTFVGTVSFIVLIVWMAVTMKRILYEIIDHLVDLIEKA